MCKGAVFLVATPAGHAGPPHLHTSLLCRCNAMAPALAPPPLCVFYFGSCHGEPSLTYAAHVHRDMVSAAAINDGGVPSLRASSPSAGNSIRRLDSQEALDERMRLEHDQAALRADAVIAASGSDAGAAAAGPRWPPEGGDDFPALPDHNASRSDTHGPAEQRAAAGWAELLRPAAVVKLPAARSSAVSDPVPHDASRGVAEGSSTADAVPARARKAAAAGQLLAEARRSVLDAMTGARRSLSPAVCFTSCPQKMPGLETIPTRASRLRSICLKSRALYSCASSSGTFRL